LQVLAVKRRQAVVRPIRHPDGSRLSPEEAARVTDETTPLEQLVVLADFGEAIYPGLRHVGSVNRGGDRRPHVVIKGENFHVLEMLQFSHAGRIDCIYIDPPYNSGARDWKYNNAYVEADDRYRHSKWLAFMERRLRLAKQLLNPENSVLLVTIDENEVHRLGLLIQQIFPAQYTQMITTVINPKGASLGRDFARVEEYIIVVYCGSAGIQAEVRDMLDEQKNEGADRTVKWSSLIRGGAQGVRTDSPGAYFPVFIDRASLKIHSFGEPLAVGSPREGVSAPRGTIPVWPPQHPSGVEGRWGIGPEKARELLKLGALRLGTVDLEKRKFPLSYLSSGIVAKIASGEITVKGRTDDGVMAVTYPENVKTTQPKTVWRMRSHNAGEYGSKMISQLLPGRKFPFPKSLYAVEDVLGFFLSANPEAVVLDFFAGSGTTAHAIARLNHRDAGRRRSILVTNNEVSSAEAARLRDSGLRPGDRKWEELGIFEHITRPRIEAALTGLRLDGQPVEGDYKFIDEFPISEGFSENAEFFELAYLDPDDVELDMAFSGVAPLLWLRAGGRGPIITDRRDAADRRRPYSVTEQYGVLFNPDRWRSFINRLPTTATVAFIVTDSQATFTGIASELPSGVAPVRLYENYMATFAMKPSY
jgi:adenine-specific DNA-methyltransferase